MRPRKFTVVTPCYNARAFLPETIASVLNQSAFLEGRAELQYVIVDGGSSDGTPAYLATLNDPRITWISERDRGMYDAVVKGFERSEGEVQSYINAGDVYFPWTFDVVAESLEDPTVNWVTGLSVLRNERGQVFQVERARRYWQGLIQRGAYGPRLPYIQQESTFWRSSLWSSVDVTRLRQLKLVGDYYLWVCMSRQNELVAVNSALAAFSIQPGQLSEAKDRYFAELAHVCDGPLSMRDRALILADKILANLPPFASRALGYDNAIRFDQGTKQWQRSR